MVRHWIASTNSVSWPDPTCQHPQLRKGILVPTNGGSPVPYMHRSVECQLFFCRKTLDWMFCHLSSLGRVERSCRARTRTCRRTSTGWRRRKHARRPATVTSPGSSSGRGTPALPNQTVTAGGSEQHRIGACVLSITKKIKLDR
jgi:hypothetical protein